MTETDPYALWDAAYILGSLSSNDRREYENHLSGCVSCRSAVGELSGMPALLAMLLTTTPAPVTPPLHLGAAFRLKQATPIAELERDPSRYFNRDVRIEGVIASACTQEGCFIEVVPEDGDGEGETLLVQLVDAAGRASNRTRRPSAGAATRADRAPRTSRGPRPPAPLNDPAPRGRRHPAGREKAPRKPHRRRSGDGRSRCR